MIDGFAKEHLPQSVKLYKFIENLDFTNGDTFCFKSGGDGDNGELLMDYLDEWFTQNAEEPPRVMTWMEAYNASKYIGHMQQTVVLELYDSDEDEDEEYPYYTILCLLKNETTYLYGIQTSKKVVCVGRDEAYQFSESEYGKKFRIWTKFPTLQQRKDTPWEE